MMSGSSRDKILGCWRNINRGKRYLGWERENEDDESGWEGFMG